MVWKKNLLWVSALIGMMVVGAAITATFGNEADAKNALGESIVVEKSDQGCEVRSVEKYATTSDEVDNEDYTVRWAMWYLRDGSLTRKSGKVMVANATDAAVKAAVQAPCEAAWVEAQAEAEIDAVIVKPELDVLGQFYDYISDKWENKPN